MAPSRFVPYRSDNKRNKNKALKRTVKFLASNNNPKIEKIILSGANDRLVKVISDSALNVLENQDIKLSKKAKRNFKTNRPLIDFLIDKKKPIGAKKKALQRGGAFPLIPLLLSTVLGTVGGAIIDKVANK